jgi:hypothetical protein
MDDGSGRDGGDGPMRNQEVQEEDKGRRRKN